MSEVNPQDYKNNLFSIGWKFGQYVAPELSNFDRLFDIFKELLIHTSGDFDETIGWMRILDKEYEFTTPEYSIDDFVEDLLKRQYVKPKSSTSGDGEGMGLTGKWNAHSASMPWSKYLAHSNALVQEIIVPIILALGKNHLEIIERFNLGMLLIKSL